MAKIFQLQKQYLRIALAIVHALEKDLKNKIFSRNLQQPTTLNLLVNDICNSKCQMCNIWQKKRDVEFTPEQLRLILQDQLFNHLQYIGISGGEPTLRKDLPDIFRVIVEKSPPIRGTGIITNAIRVDQVRENIIACSEICKRASVPFSVMISLDGVGEIHDHVRGREGNFESAISLLNYLREQTDIPVSFGCTITKDNVWHVDEILDFANEEGLYGRFRVAEFIERLYNSNQSNYIRNFSPLENYHLALFFAKLEATFERDPIYRRTYRNIRDMLLGNFRTINCPYQTEAVLLDSRGQLLYCAPKSPVIGNALKTSAYNIYENNLGIRESIIKNSCKDCIHDYHTSPTTRDYLLKGEKLFWSKWYSVRVVNLRHSIQSIFKKKLLLGNLSVPTSALVVGWYGTETVGDKAILGEILHLLDIQGITQITLASLFPFVSEWTVKELGFPGVEVIEAYSKKLEDVASTSDLTIMGGGPLMDVNDLGMILSAFWAAKKAGHQTHVAGCGIGPLTNPDNIRTVKKILELSDKTEMRDVNSVEWVRMNTDQKNVSLTGDYATGFVLRWLSRNKIFSNRHSENILNLYLRELPREYRGELSDANFNELKDQFEEELSYWIHELCLRYKLRPRLWPMHVFFVGGDDREFYRRFARTYLKDLDPEVEDKPLSVHEILLSMSNSALNFCMRFHSVLFAQTLGTPFVAIDYTNGGKILNFLSDANALEHMISVDEISTGKWQDFQVHKMLRDITLNSDKPKKI